MELGNLAVGNSRGEFEIDRGFQDYFCTKLEEMGFNCYGATNGNEKLDKINRYCGSYNIFENDTFWVMPYYWGDCNCGYDNLEYKWTKNNKHEENCYQTLVNNELKNNGWVKNKVFLFLEPPKDFKYSQYTKIEDEIRKKYCKKLNLSFPNGCAIHCTCNHRRKWIEFLEKNYHKENCPIILPNFWWKKEGVKIKWYKYPLRDSYSNIKIDQQLLEKMLLDCIYSLN